MRSAVSSSSVRDQWGNRRGLLLILWLILHLMRAFLSWSLRICCLSQSLRILAPSPSLPFCAWVSIGLVEYFPLNSFSVMVPVGGCMQGWFPLAGLPWIPPCYDWGFQAPVQPLRHQFPSSSIGDEFNISSASCMWRSTFSRRISFPSASDGRSKLIQTSELNWGRRRTFQELSFSSWKVRRLA